MIAPSRGPVFLNSFTTRPLPPRMDGDKIHRLNRPGKRAYFLLCSPASRRSRSFLTKPTAHPGPPLKRSGGYRGPAQRRKLIYKAFTLHW